MPSTTSGAVPSDVSLLTRSKATQLLPEWMLQRKEASEVLAACLTVCEDFAAHLEELWPGGMGHHLP